MHHGSQSIVHSLTLEEILRRPEIQFKSLTERFEDLKKIEDACADQMEIETKYQGYIDRQRQEIEKFRKWEAITIPENLDYLEVAGLSTEVREKLSRQRPESLGRASRISGITPAAVTAIRIYLKRKGLTLD
jgi:tRNA uridine 5-carboxymethylaminomethyl modification enzyme